MNRSPAPSRRLFAWISASLVGGVVSVSAFFSRTKEKDLSGAGAKTALYHGKEQWMRSEAITTCLQQPTHFIRALTAGFGFTFATAGEALCDLAATKCRADTECAIIIFNPELYGACAPGVDSSNQNKKHETSALDRILWICLG